MIWIRIIIIIPLMSLPRTFTQQIMYTLALTYTLALIPSYHNEREHPATQA